MKADSAIPGTSALRFCVLASGSKANATYISNGRDALLIDCGLSAKECLARMLEYNLNPLAIRGIILTHEHQDHCRGIQILSKKLNIPVLTSQKTWRKCHFKGELIAMRSELDTEFEGFKIRPFSVSHDAVDPLGFVIEKDNCRLGYCTDLGQANTVVYDNLAGCHALILESNHDPDMLASGPYPDHLKQRVASAHGHLSNQSALDLLERLWQPMLKVVVAAHISQINNSPELLRAQWLQRLAGLPDKLHMLIAHQDYSLPVVDLHDFVDDEF